MPPEFHRTVCFDHRDAVRRLARSLPLPALMLSSPYSKTAPSTAADYDAWSVVPEVLLSRWESIRELLARTMEGPQRLAILGYPTPRAALRVVAGCPKLTSVALVSPVPGYAEHTRRLAARACPHLPVVSLQRSATASALRGAGFRTVLARMPIIAGDDLSRLPEQLDPLLQEMIRVGTANARFLVHATVQMSEPCDGGLASEIGQRFGERLQWFGLRDAYLGAYAIGGGSRSAEVIGWARRVVTA